MNYFLAYMHHKLACQRLGIPYGRYADFVRALQSWTELQQNEAFRFWNAAC